MLEAALYAVLGASSLVLGAALVYLTRPSRLVIGCVMAFGAGALISAVSFELVLKITEMGRATALAGGLAAGALAFYLGDAWIDARGGDARKRSTGQQESGSALAIVFGTLLDGVPESFILGLTLVAGGGVSWAFLAAVALSNLPEAMAATYGLDGSGWKRNNVVWMWIGLAVLSGIAGAIGFATFSAMPAFEGALVQAFAAGALLTMLADTMMPEAFQYAGRTVGLFTVLGFGVSIAISTLD
ncbi:MAG: ZIP family metal transporter [Actinomycetota bacterium]